MDRPDRWTMHPGACRPGHGSTFPLCSQQGIIPCVTNSSDRSSRRAGLCFRVMMAVGLSQLLARWRWPGTSPVSGIQVPASSTDCFRRPSKTYLFARVLVYRAHYGCLTIMRRRINVHCVNWELSVYWTWGRRCAGGAVRWPGY